MKMNFANIDMYDRPILILKRADGTPIGVLGNAKDVEVQSNYNELSILSFTLPAYVDGERTPFYDDVTGQKIIELKGIAQFAVTQPKESGDKVSMSKFVEAKSLECEFGRKKLTLPESTYKFFDATNTDGTTLGMMMELMPNWTVGSVAATIRDKYRTFEISGENLYNFIKGTAQQAYNCIFDFDTLNRVVSVRDADDTPAEKQVYISRDNLAKDIEVTEQTDDMVTRLEVSGADGVDIREVNPTGTNYIVNLDYFMTTDHFDQVLVDKYNAWKALIENNRRSFYNYAIQYSMRISEEIAENAKLVDLQGEYTSLENIQAVIIQGIAAGQSRQDDLDVANANLSAKQTEIANKQLEIDGIVAERESTLASIQAIRDQCAYDNYFTLAERRIMDPYIFDNSVEETSFVASEVQSYTDGAGNGITNQTIQVTNAVLDTTADAAGSTLYSISGGSINVAGLITGTVISSIFEKRGNGKIVLSVYIGNGSYSGTNFPSGCVSISGTGNVTVSGTTVTCSVTDGYLFFSLNASDYEKKTVAWELYEYGEALLAKMAVPTYSFSVDSANFIALDEFELFKNELELGQRIYIQIGSGEVLKPICTGAKFKYHDRPYLELLFNDTFTANDSEAKLVDILDNSISMGKTLSSGKFTYEAWTGSGASSELRDFITSALDTAKNAIVSSTEQAVTWDGAGLRLRKYSNDAHTAYEPEQIWINNNSIMMTDTAWATAKMAIGKIHDANVGDQWGIIAEMIVGTLIAGEELVIESQKQDGGTAIFRMDADGCRLYNAEFSIQKTNTDGTTTQIILDPDVGIAMGAYPVLNGDGSINTANAKFYVDASGTMHLAGTIVSYDGNIGGWTISQDGLYSGETDATRVGITSSGDIRIWAGNLVKQDAPFYVTQDGRIHSSSGDIGGWYIGTDYIGNASTKANSTTGMASGSASSVWTFWAGDAQATAPFRVNTSGKIYASNIEATGGTVGGWYIGTDYIGNASTKAGSTVGMASGTGTNIIFWAGAAQASAKFRVNANGKVYASDLEIKGGSIEIKSGDTIMFSVTDQGYLTAQSGRVGGWYIGSNYIGNAATKANSTVGMSASTTANDVVFWAGGAQATAPFRVTGGGVVYASEIHVTGGTLTIGGQSVFNVSNTGALTAASGSVGGWNIGSDFFGNKSSLNESTVGFHSSTTESDIVLWAGDVRSKAKFSVTAGGALSATGANISGAITASSLTMGNTRITDIDLYIEDKIDGKGFLLSADFTKFTTEYYSTVGDLQKKTVYLQDSGHIELNAFTSEVATGIISTKAGITIDASGKIDISALSNDAQGSLNKAAKIELDSSGKIVLSSSNFSSLSTSSLSITSSGIEITTAGSFIVSAGNFQVDSTGAVTIRSLLVADSSGTHVIDLSGNFSNAVSLSSGGSWDGNTFTATVKLWGKINKTISMDAAVEIKSISVDDTMFNDQYAVLNVVMNHTVNDSTKSDISVSFNQVNVRQIANEGWKLAAGKVNYVSGNTYVTVPNASSYGNTTTLKIASGGCFVKGSQVLLSNGSTISIEALTVGANVVAYNESTGEFEDSEVQLVHAYKHKNDIYDITLSSGDTLTLTGSHPVLTTHGWKAANADEVAAREHPDIAIEQLSVGDAAITTSGESEIISIARRNDLDDETVYNIDVEPIDTYIVNSVVVHNANEAGKD